MRKEVEAYENDVRKIYIKIGEDGVQIIKNGFGEFHNNCGCTMETREIIDDLWNLLVVKDTMNFNKQIPLSIMSVEFFMSPYKAMISFKGEDEYDVHCREIHGDYKGIMDVISMQFE